MASPSTSMFAQHGKQDRICSDVMSRKGRHEPSERTAGLKINAGMDSTM